MFLFQTFVDFFLCPNRVHYSAEHWYQLWQTFITKMSLAFPKAAIFPSLFPSLFKFYTNTKNPPKASAILNCLPVLISRAIS